MSRLIDAYALIEMLLTENQRCITSTGHELTMGMIVSFIENQPTAYDVEKVIEDLADNSRFIDDINEHNIKCISCVIGQKTAIDIVKKGGVE